MRFVDRGARTCGYSRWLGGRLGIQRRLGRHILGRNRINNLGLHYFNVRRWRDWRRRLWCQRLGFFHGQFTSHPYRADAQCIQQGQRGAEAGILFQFFTHKGRLMTIAPSRVWLAAG